MKRSSILSALLLSAAALLPLASCDSDLDRVYVLPADDVTLGGASADVRLDATQPEALALTLYWSGDGQLALTDEQLQAPVNAEEQTIELAADADFATTVDVALDKGVRQHQFLSEELNALVGRLGMEADVWSTLYIRVRSVLAANMEPSYSNVLAVRVMPYRLHLTLATVLDANWSDTGQRLASPQEDGTYAGFLGVNSWTNWWLREANNVVWGNVGADGMTFSASSDDDHWNFWFPGLGGCYFTTVNTTEGWWSALHIDALSVSGDVSGNMEYNQSANQWTLAVNMPAAQTVTISIAGQGSLYDRSTTDMGPATPQSVAFGGDSQALSFGTSGSPITLDLPAGETTLVLDLSNPLAYTVAAGEAAEEPEASPLLYLSGVVNWDFEDYLTLYDESTLAYGGAHYVNSEWGWRVYPQPDWGTAYKAGDGSTPLSGTLVLAEGEGNVPQPEPGLYVMDISMSSLTYQLTAVTSVTYTGLDDDWTEREMTASPDNPEVFTAEFVKQGNTPWGVKVLINHDWGLFFGGSDGQLRLGHSDATTGFDGDNELSVGQTYVLTVDLGRQTYSYSLK